MDIILNAQEIMVLFRQDPDRREDGGYQGLLVRLQNNTNPDTGALRLTPEDLERIRRYAFDYGNGGWEDRLTAIFARHLGPRLGRP